VDHAQFENVSSKVQDGMKRLFDPSKSHLSVWVWIYDPESPWRRSERSERPGEARATPLHYAAACNMHDIAMFLIVEHSQDVNARGFDEEETPLHVSSYRGHVEIARVLLKHGADIEARDSADYSLLESVALRGHVALAQLLLEHGADASAQGKESRATPLYWASAVGQLAVAQVLLSHGADVTAQCEDNQTPLHRAENEEVAQLLLEHGADASALDIEESDTVASCIGTRTCGSCSSPSRASCRCECAGQGKVYAVVFGIVLGKASSCSDTSQSWRRCDSPVQR
jgi:hypothetical protein